MSHRPGLNPALYSSDPFCSAGCARKHFGTEITRKVAT
jgi:hypothetical protein